MQRRFILKLAAVFSATALLANVAQADETIKVGVTGGPHAQVMEVVKQLAAKNGLNIKIVEFADYVQPNAALASGDLDANSYQHAPYLDAQVKDRGYKLIKIADTVTFPMGIYSKKFKSLAQLPVGARIAVPNDPTNGGRVLLVLQDKGLIKLKPEAGLKATPLDVIENPKKLKFVELDAAQLPRSLDDLTIAAINNDYAGKAGLSLDKDAVIKEAAKGPYANIIAVRRADKDKPWAKRLVAAYQSPEVKSFIETQFKGSLVPAF